MSAVDELASLLIQARTPRAVGGTGQLETPHVDDMSDQDLRNGEFRAQLNEQWTQEMFSIRADFIQSDELEAAWQDPTYYGGHDAYRWVKGMPTIYDRE